MASLGAPGPGGEEEVRIQNICETIRSNSKRTGKKSLTVSADGNVQEHVQRAVGQRSPCALVTDHVAGEPVELGAILCPGDDLAGPVVVGAVDLDGPRVPVIVRHGGGALAAQGLLAASSRVHVAVDGGVGGRGAADLLHDVDLAALRPPGAVAERVAQHPKGGPDALLAALQVPAEPDAALDLHDAAGRGGPGVAGLDAARRPGPVGVAARHDLEGAAARDLHVFVGGRVHLVLVVGVDIEGDLPHVLVDRGAGGSREGLLKDELEALFVGGADGGREGWEEGEDGGRLEEHGVG